MAFPNVSQSRSSEIRFQLIRLSWSADSNGISSCLSSKFSIDLSTKECEKMFKRISEIAESEYCEASLSRGVREQTDLLVSSIKSVKNAEPAIDDLLRAGWDWDELRDLKIAMMKFREVALDEASLRHGPVNRGRKYDNREPLWDALSNSFEAAGGKVAASYKPTKGKVDGPFIAFCVEVLSYCPEEYRNANLPGLGESVRKWRRQKRAIEHEPRGLILYLKKKIKPFSL